MAYSLLHQVLQPDAPGDSGVAEEEPAEGEAPPRHLHDVAQGGLAADGDALGIHRRPARLQPHRGPTLCRRPQPVPVIQVSQAIGSR